MILIIKIVLIAALPPPAAFVHLVLRFKSFRSISQEKSQTISRRATRRDRQIHAHIQRDTDIDTDTHTHTHRDRGTDGDDN